MLVKRSHSCSHSTARALVTPPSSRLTCTICQEVFVKPVHLLPCCHCFCEKCIKEWTRNSSTCPICRESLQYDEYANKCTFKKAILLIEFLEDLEVHCKFGVKLTGSCQHFGVVGSDFEALPDGCPVKAPLKNIQRHEDKCPYGRNSTVDLLPLMEENENLIEQVHILARKVASLSVSVQLADAEAETYKELYEESRVVPFDSYRYAIEDARIFARFIATHMFDSSKIDLVRCFTALQRLASEWERRKLSFEDDDRKKMHYLFYTATMCDFWTPKQNAKLREWCFEFDPDRY